MHVIEEWARKWLRQVADELQRYLAAAPRVYPPERTAAYSLGSTAKPAERSLPRSQPPLQISPASGDISTEYVTPSHQLPVYVQLITRRLIDGVHYADKAVVMHEAFHVVLERLTFIELYGSDFHPYCSYPLYIVTGSAKNHNFCTLYIHIQEIYPIYRVLIAEEI